jgi:hypothetical protein
MRCGSRPESPDPHVRLRHSTVKRRETGTAPDSDPASKSGSAFRTARYASTFHVVWRMERKLLNDRRDPSPVLGSRPSRTGPQSCGHCILLNARWPRWTGQSSKTTNGPKSGFKVMKSFEKFNQVVSLLWFAIADLQLMTDPRFGSGSKFASRAK